MLLICCGMIRSGSTLQYNLVRSLLETTGRGRGEGFFSGKRLAKITEQLGDWAEDPDYHVLKTHTLPTRLDSSVSPTRFRTFYIYRDLRDVAASTKEKADISDEQLLDALDEAIEVFHGVQAIASEGEPVLLQRYECVTDDCTAAVRDIGDFLGIQPSATQIETIVAECSLDTVIETMDQVREASNPVVAPVRSLWHRLLGRLGLVGPEERQIYDEDTLVHEDHVSSNRGSSGTWGTRLSNAELQTIVRRYGDWLRTQGYPVEKPSSPGQRHDPPPPNRGVRPWRFVALKKLEAALQLLHRYSPLRPLRKQRVERARREGATFTAPMPNGAAMLVDPQMYYAKIFIKGRYEPEVLSFLKRTVNAGDCCMDIGANVGFVSLFLARLVGADGKVVAFEPTPTSAEVLEDNVALNRMSHVRVERLALSNAVGELTLNVGEPGFEVYNSAGDITHPGAEGGRFHSMTVPMTTLDRYLSEHDLPEPQVVKIDVEGAELEVLEGMRATLRRSSPVLLVEFSDLTAQGFTHTADDLRRWIEDQGYHLDVMGPFGTVRPISDAEVWSGQMVVGRRR